MSARRRFNVALLDAGVDGAVDHDVLYDGLALVEDVLGVVGAGGGPGFSP